MWILSRPGNNILSGTDTDVFIGLAVLVTLIKGIHLYCNSDVCAGRHQRSCYTIVSDHLDAHSARSRCQSMGGDLVTIDSQAENAVVHNILKVASKWYME